MLANYEQFSGKIPPSAATISFADANTISDYAKNPVNKLTLQGSFRDWPSQSTGKFNSMTVITRAEVATAFSRWIESMK